MDTGGTRDIITHDVTGLLPTSPEELGSHTARLVADEALRARLAAAARAHVDATFDARAVVSRIATLYKDLRAAVSPPPDARITSEPPAPSEPANTAHA